MKIAIVIERFAPGTGGAERSTAELSAELRSRGHEITILAGAAKAPDGAGETDPGFTIRICPSGAPKGVMRLRMFRRWVQRETASGFDASLSVISSIPAMVVEPRAGLIPDLQSRSLAWRSGAWSRLVRRVALGLNLRQRTLLALERQTLRDPAVKRIVGISGMIMRSCAAHYPDVKSKLVYVGNAIKPLVVSPGEAAAWRARWRAEWGVPEEETIFFLPSLDSRRKGLTPLLRALGMLRKGTAPKASLILLGKVHRSQERLIAALGLKDAVRQIGFQSDIRPFYCATDVTVLPAYYDPFPRVIIESLMLGRPAITTAYAGAAELVAPFGGPLRGRVINDPDDIAALAGAMGEMCDPRQRERCIAAIGNALETHTIRRHVDGLLQVFADCGAR